MCEEITKAELELLKRYSLAKLGKNRVDTIDSIHTLFTVLQQAGLLKSDDVEYLKELFQVFERNDLLDMIREYEVEGKYAQHYF